MQPYFVNVSGIAIIIVATYNWHYRDAIVIPSSKQRYNMLNIEIFIGGR